MPHRATVVTGEWMTTEEVIQELGKSRRTIQKLAKANHLRYKAQSQLNGPPIRVYRADDVARVKAAPPRYEPPRSKREHAIARRIPQEQQQSPQQVNVLDLLGVLMSAQQSHMEVVSAQLAEFVGAQRERWKDERERWRVEQEAKQPKKFLTIPQAAEIAGLSQGAIRREITAGRLTAVRGGPGGAFRIHPASFERFLAIAPTSAAPKLVRSASA